VSASIRRSREKAWRKVGQAHTPCVRSACIIDAGPYREMDRGICTITSTGPPLSGGGLSAPGSLLRSCASQQSCGVLRPLVLLLGRPDSVLEMLTKWLEKVWVDYL
jgi:hypothetical protein